MLVHASPQFAAPVTLCCALPMRIHEPRVVVESYRRLHSFLHLSVCVPVVSPFPRFNVGRFGESLHYLASPRRSRSSETPCAGTGNARITVPVGYEKFTEERSHFISAAVYTVSIVSPFRDALAGVLRLETYYVPDTAIEDFRGGCCRESPPILVSFARSCLEMDRR